MNDELSLRRIKNKIDNNHSEKSLALALGAEFGTRLASLQKQGFSREDAFKIIKDNFKRTGMMMLFISEQISFDEIKD